MPRAMLPRGGTSWLTAIALLSSTALAASPPEAVRPGDPDWPRVWTTYRPVGSLEEDLPRLRAAGVGAIARSARSEAEARKLLGLVRRHGLRIVIDIPDITEHADLVEREAGTAVPAVMLGGVHRGRAIDRHLFTFSPGPQEITVEPPVYNREYAYTRGSGAVGRAKEAERIAHYYPDIGPPVRAEIVVPRRLFDGAQHLTIVTASIEEMPPGTRVEEDSLAGLPETEEGRGRRLYRLRFDLSGLEGVLLDRVGVAVYWEYSGSSQYWMFGRGSVSARATSTRTALRATVRRTIETWSRANGGSFPHDAVIALRFGDECFFITGHLNGPAVSYPLWDFSEPSLRAFRARAGPIEHPRTWGHPEIYGPDAAAWWLHALHEGCAELCGVAREEVDRLAPGLLVFRNQTRMGVFHPSNDHDGSGQDLLSRHLDLVHLDPYPVGRNGYSPCIPRDMSYCAGLARRYGKPLVPWMQAHVYGPGGLEHVAPGDVDRMAAEQSAQGVDAIMWLGYGPGFTFPAARPESWERAIELHRRLAAAPPKRPRARLAVLRSYRAWAASGHEDGRLRNPADWLLQQWLEVWAVEEGRPYDVFEVAPRLTRGDRKALEASLSTYELRVSTEPREDAWVIGEGTSGTTADPASAGEVRARFRREIEERGWLRGEDGAAAGRDATKDPTSALRRATRGEWPIRWYLPPEEGPVVGNQNGWFVTPDDILPGEFTLSGKVRKATADSFEMTPNCVWGRYTYRITRTAPPDQPTADLRLRDVVPVRSIRFADLPELTAEQTLLFRGTLREISSDRRVFHADVGFRGGPVRCRLDLVAREETKTAPDVRSMRYGPHWQHTMDVYYPKEHGARPLPVILYIHGGGWGALDKENVNRDVPRWTGLGFAVVSVNYRFVSSAHEHPAMRPPVAAPLHDAARALQHLRHRARELGIDPRRIAATGGSAGGATTCWLALHDDLADPSSPDPVARESTRLACAFPVQAQTSLDPRQMRQWIPQITYGAHAFFTRKESGPRETSFDHLLSRRTEILPWIREYSPYEHASADDPPMLHIYGGHENVLPATGPGHATHHPKFGEHLHRRLKGLGVESHFWADDVRCETARYHGWEGSTRFVCDHLLDGEDGARAR